MVNAEELNSMFGGYIGCPDNDKDGWADLIDPFDDDDSQWKDTDGDGYGDNPNGNTPDLWPLDTSQWFDSDNDGYGDNEFGTRGDSCPQEEGYSTLDKFGCVDSDGDGWSDNGDAFPQTPSQFADRDGDGWGDNQSENAELIDLFPSDGTQWNDADGDGHGDNRYGTEGDWFPNDPNRWADSDRDGVADEDDAFINDATQSSDRDGDLWGDDPLGNRADEFPDDPTEWKDTDGDGVNDANDAFPEDPVEIEDSDGDGVGDVADAYPMDASRSAEEGSLSMPFWIALVIVVMIAIAGSALFLMRKLSSDEDGYEGAFASELAPAEDIYAMAGIDSAAATNVTQSESDATMQSTGAMAPAHATLNEHGQKTWVDEVGNTWCQNPDGSMMRFDTESGAWVPHQ